MERTVTTYVSLEDKDTVAKFIKNENQYGNIIGIEKQEGCYSLEIEIDSLAIPHIVQGYIENL